MSVLVGAGGLALGLGLLLIVVVIVAKSMLFIARPHEALVFSGKAQIAEDGSARGYRIVRQGRRGWRIPIIERVDRMDMRLLPVNIVVQNAYSAGNIPLKIHAIANVKIHSDPRFIGNAMERFLGVPLNEVQTVAQQTLEGAVREVIAKLTPEQVNEDRLGFAEGLIRTAQDDLHKLGLQLDTLKIQNVSDETGYLDSLGRPVIAAALRDAENAENQLQQEITRAQATSTQRAQVSEARAGTSIVKKTNELRQVRAELEGVAQSVELEAVAAAKTARATAEKELQSIRSTLEQKRLHADVVLPAEADREAKATLAVGQAAPTVEDGSAAVQVLELMTEAWREMGPEAREIYVIQHLEEIVGTVVNKLNDIDVGEVHMLDQGDGSALASYAAAYPNAVASVLRSLADTTGVDVPAILAQREEAR